jgi:hypothetical protein
MQATPYRLLVLAGLSGLLTACASTSFEPAPVPLELPVTEEPAHESATYTDLASATVTVRWSTADLKEQLKREFPVLAMDRSSLVLVEESLISSDGVFFRRVWMSYGDETTFNIHGTCGQNIYLWFDQDGERVGTYVDPMDCPI